MHSFTLLLLVAMATTAYAVGQFYVPRSYYVIDAEGHESEPVPLRRLRRSLDPYPYLNRDRRDTAAQRNQIHGGRPAYGRHLSAHGDWRTMSTSHGGPVPVRKP